MGGGNRESDNPTLKHFLYSSSTFFTYFFILFIVIYVINIVIFANFSVIDDHTLLGSLALGKYMGFFIYPQIGRFFPLDAMDLNIIYSIFGLNASIFYLFNAIFATILILCLVKYLSIVLDSKNLAFLLILILLTSPAFITAFLRLFVPEKLESMFFAIFITAFVLFSKKQNSMYLILAIISANIALYYKEVAFIMLGSFAFFHLCFGYSQLSLKAKLLDTILIISCIIWIAAYIFVVVLVKTSSGSYGDTPYNPLIVALKNILNYSLNEPFLFIGIFGILIFRIYLVLRKKDHINPMLDSCLLACAIHSLSYFVLNIYSYHYPLPAYIFAIFSIGFYFRKYINNIFIKIVFFTCFMLYILNQIPAFVYQFNYYKSVPNNFQATISFLDSYLKNNPNTSIYLEGVNRASGVEVHHSFAKYLESLGNNNFDLKSDLKIDNVLLGKEKPDSRYSVFKSNDVIEKSEGDLVIVTPFSTFTIDEKYLDSKNYKLLFESKWGFDIPLIGIKTFIKSFMSTSNLMQSSNTFALPIHFSVYKMQRIDEVKQ